MGFARAMAPATRALPSLLLACLAGCPQGGGALDAGPDAGAQADAGGGGGDAGPLDAGAVPADGGLVDVTRFAPGCRALPSTCGEFDAGASCGECQYRLRYDATRCTAATPCDNLLLVWAAMTCDADEWTRVAGAVAGRDGWMTACVQPIWPGEVLPSTIGAPERDLAVMGALLGEARGPWSGKNLLMAGCSAGATRYPLVAARTTADAQWLGTQKTGVCMSDGVYNIPHQEAFIGAGLLDGGASCAFRHRRMVQGFTQATGSPGHSCASNPQCACNPTHATRTRPGACLGGDCVAYESVVVPGGQDGGFGFAPGLGASDFAVSHWRLVSEGAGLTDDPCGKDVVAGEPLLGLCAALDAASTHDCTPAEFPAAPHCSAYWQTLGTTCVDWFQGL